MRLPLIVKEPPTTSAPSGEDQFAVGKGLHTSIDGYELEVADRRRGRFKKTSTDPIHGRRILATALEPGLEIVGFADYFRLLHVQPSLLDERRPLLLGINPAMGRVAEQLDLILVGGTIRVLGCSCIDEDEDPAGSQHASYLAHRPRNGIA